MIKIFITLSMLFSVNNFAQEKAINATFINIGNAGNADMRDIKLVGNNLFFTGKEFYKRNFVKYNFLEDKYTTFSTNEELLEYDDTNYIVINDIIYFKSSNKTIKSTNDSNEFEIFYSGNELLDFKQIGDSFFTFINKRPADNNNRNFYYDLYLFNGINNTLIQLSTNENNILNGYTSPIIYTPNNTIYYSISNRYYKYDIENSLLSSIETDYSNLNFLSIGNEVFAVGSSYPATNSLFKLNQNNHLELVNQYKDQEISYNKVEKILEYQGKIYFISNGYLSVLDSATNSLERLDTINIESYHDLQIYNNEIFISLKSPWPAVYKTYRINGTQVEEFLLPNDDKLSNYIIYNHKMFYNKATTIFDGRIKYYDLITGETNNINLNYNFPTAITLNYPFIYNNNLYFSSSSKFDGSELFKFNPSYNEAEVVKNYNTTIGSFPNTFYKVNNNILFLANGNHIYNFDLDNYQPKLLFDKERNTYRSSSTYNTVNLGNRLIFSNDKYELGFTDGTAEGTSIFEKKAHNENALEYIFGNGIILNNKAIFKGKTKYKGEEIWASDGTPEGTTILQDILDGYESSNPLIDKNGLLNNKLYFVARKENYHSLFSSIFVTEGTPETTKRLNYNGEAVNELRILGTFKNKLIIYEKQFISPSTDFFLLDPITLEKVMLDNLNSPDFFFEFNDTLYISAYNNLGYYDENFQLQHIEVESSLNLSPIKQIGNKFYLESLKNGHIYVLKDNKLQIVLDDYVIPTNERDIIIKDDKIIFLRLGSFDNGRYYSLQLVTIDANGITYRDVNLEDFSNDPIYFMPKLNIIDDKIYLGIEHPKYGSELYIADYDETILNTTNLNTSLELKAHFHIYPNPTTDVVQINSRNENDILQISIFNLAGQKLKTIKLEQNNKLNVKDLKKGIYFIKISNGFNIETKKLIIK